MPGTRAVECGRRLGRPVASRGFAASDRGPAEPVPRLALVRRERPRDDRLGRVAALGQVGGRHGHAGTSGGVSLAANVVGCRVVTLRDVVQSGALAHVPPIHRQAINRGRR